MPFPWAFYADRDEANMQKEIDIVIDSMAVQLFLHFRKRKIDVIQFTYRRQLFAFLTKYETTACFQSGS
jgi:hypothetical protein